MGTPTFWSLVRLLAFVVLSWVLLGWVAPWPDPIAIGVAWLLLVIVLLAIPWTRWRLLRWIVNGRFGRGV